MPELKQSISDKWDTVFWKDFSMSWQTLSVFTVEVPVVSCDSFYVSLETGSYLFCSESFHFLLTSGEMADTQHDQRGPWEAPSVSPFTWFELY